MSLKGLLSSIFSKSIYKTRKGQLHLNTGKVYKAPKPGFKDGLCSWWLGWKDKAGGCWHLHVYFCIVYIPTEWKRLHYNCVTHSLAFLFFEYYLVPISSTNEWVSLWRFYAHIHGDWLCVPSLYFSQPPSFPISLGPSSSPSSPSILFWAPHTEEHTRHLSIFSLEIWPPLFPSIFLQMTQFHSLWLNKMQLWLYVIISFPIQLLMGT